jgi:hypothetical protein
MMDNRISLWYEVIRCNRHLNTFVILTRYLIGFAFVPSGLTKLLGERFTQMGIEEPVGFFFEALYRTGFYWNFLGLGQVFAAFLLMTQRFATAGAIIFFFIVVNVWLITVSMEFQGTWLITSLMMLATILLLIWDFHVWKFIFYPQNSVFKMESKNYPGYNKIWVITGFILFTGSIAAFFLLRWKASFGLGMGGLMLIVVVVAIVFNERYFRKTEKARMA